MKEWLEVKSPDDIKSEQEKDSKIATVLKWKEETDERPEWESASHLDADHKPYWSQWNRLVIKDAILYRQWVTEVTGQDRFELVMPETWRAEIIKMLHASPGAGHFGIKRTTERLRSRAY